MKVIVGRYAGFCPGVMNSVSKAEDAVNHYKEIYCLGELIHNKTVVLELEKKGIQMVNDINDIPNGSVVIFRAHGVKESIYKEALEKELHIIDLTCNIVKNIHEKVKQARDDSFIIIIGDSKHPETIGTKDFAGNNAFVVGDAEDIDKAFTNFITGDLKKVFVISQTTFSLAKFEELVLIIEDRFKDYELSINNSICKVTELRQKEVEELSKEVDCVIVVGGKNSSNTKKIYDISMKNCKRVLHIEKREELDSEDFSKWNNVLIVAGASTPKKIVEEVKQYLESR